MTRDEAKEAAMVMLAYANGEQVQVQLSDGSWIDFPINPNFDWQHVNYRIKPKPESKYRPFETKEECWNEMKKHQPFGWVVTKNTDAYVHICSVCGEYAGQPPKVVFEYGNPCFTFEQIFSIYNFADGTPFGIKEE